jgi:hypothetical protein
VIVQTWSILALCLVTLLICVAAMACGSPHLSLALAGAAVGWHYGCLAGAFAVRCHEKGATRCS